MNEPMNASNLGTTETRTLQRTLPPTCLVIATRRLQEKNIETQSLSQELQYKERLIQDVRHELSNALTVILGYSSLLLMKELGQGACLKLRKRLEWIHHNAETCNQLLEDLSEASHVSEGPSPRRGSVGPRPLAEGHPSMSLRPVSARRLCEVAVESLCPSAQEKGVALLLDEISEDKVQADPVRVQQILSNLILNALKFTPKGGEVRLGACKEGNFMRFFVQDTGIGIHPEELKRVFERSYQGRNRCGKAGQGLGLAISKRLVEAHGGRIWAEIQPGLGSRFYFILPLISRPSLSEASRPAVTFPSAFDRSAQGKVMEVSTSLILDPSEKVYEEELA